MIVIQISSGFIFSDNTSSPVNYKVVDYPEYVITLLTGYLSFNLRDQVWSFFSLIKINWNKFKDDFKAQNAMLCDHNPTVLGILKLIYDCVLLKLWIKALSFKDRINECRPFLWGSHEKFENFVVICVVFEPQWEELFFCGDLLFCFCSIFAFFVALLYWLASSLIWDHIFLIAWEGGNCLQINLHFDSTSILASHDKLVLKYLNCVQCKVTLDV